MTSRPPTRALHVLDHSLPIGSGYSYRSRSIVTFQKRLGLDPVVLTSPKQGTNTDGREQVDGITHYRTGRAGGRLPFARELLLMARMAARIIRVARAEGVDLIHAHSPSLNGLPALWAGRRLGLPVIYEVRTFWEDAAVNNGTFTEGSLRYRVSRALETVVLRRAHRVVAICEGIRSEIISRGIPPERIALVPNGVDPEWLEPRTRATEIANHLGLGDGPVFGYIGSFSRYEGLAFLIDAMPELLGRFPNAKLLLVGGGRDEEAVRKAAGNIGAAVLVPGRVPQEDVRDFYTVVDVFVLPRRRIRLTELVTPLKPLEAMAMGLPVLASDIGGHAEIVNNGQTGLLFKTESSKSLVEQARRLGEDRDLRAQLGAGGRQWVEAERTWERIVARYPPIYGGVA
ncbi:MAG: glycosyltransferase, exosortase A system-associated [Candidatus Rokuibacteriota bacterium]|nr:MAG: glycosyltransferase, exosortase A system-associated [Candidatus Rokubacteria bacterium]